MMLEDDFPAERPDSNDQLTPKTERLIALGIHLSQLANFGAPPLGIIIPIVLWAIYKDGSPQINAQGRMVVNWFLSALIYSVICGILMLVLIGFFGFVLLGILCFVYPIIGAIKASDGHVWKYPGTIQFI